MKNILLPILILLAFVTGVSFLIKDHDDEVRKDAITKASTDSLENVKNIKKKHKIDSINKFYAEKIDSINYAMNTLSIKQSAIERKVKSLEKKEHAMELAQTGALSYEKYFKLVAIERKDQELGINIHDLLMKKWEYSNEILELLRQQSKAINSI